MVLMCLTLVCFIGISRSLLREMLIDSEDSSGTGGIQVGGRFDAFNSYLFCHCLQEINQV